MTDHQEPTLNDKPLKDIYAEQLARMRAANCYDIHDAAQAIALQLGLNEYLTETLRDDMAQAAFDGKLTVRSPRGHDQFAPTSPPKTTYGFDCLVTPEDVNEWAMKRRLLWTWTLEQPAPEQSPAMPAPVVAVEPASDGPAKRSNRKPPWATVAMPYMKSLFTAGHYKSAAMFYKALMRRAGESDSPFTLVNRELYCTAAGTTVSDGALGNVWAEIRAH